MEWTNEQIAEAIRYNLKEVGYIDTNIDDFDDFMRLWQFETIEQFGIYEELEKECD